MINTETLRALVDAGNRLDSAMDMQEQRERGTFHLSQQAAAGVWKDARRVWAEAVKKALSAGETVECGGCAPPAIAAAAPAAPTVLANGGMVRAPSAIHEKDVTGTFKPHSLAYAAGWNECRQAILAVPAVEVDEAMELRLCETKFKVEPLFEHPKAPEGAQPVAYMHDYGDRVRVVWNTPWSEFPAGTQFYTTPPQPQDAVRDREDVRS